VALVAREGVGGDVGQQPGGGDGGPDEHPVERSEAAKPGVAAGMGVCAQRSAHEHDSVQIRLSGIYPSMRSLS
jgi:hypothetical protein